MEGVLLEHDGIVVKYDGAVLTLECAGLERKFDLSGGTARSVGLRLGGKEIAGQGGSLPRDFYVIGMRQDSEDAPFSVKDVAAEWVEGLNESPHAEVAVSIEDAFCGILYVRRYYMYPKVAAIGVRTELETAVVPHLYWSRRGNLNKYGDKLKQESWTDALRLPSNCKMRSIEFFGRTDYTDKLCEEHTESELMNGNILVADGADACVAFLQEAPPSSERRDYELHDFRIVHDGDCTELYSCGWGVSPEELALRRAGRRVCGDRHVLFAFENASELPRIIKDYLRVRYPLPPEKSGKIVVNPWGCGRFRDLTCEQFLLDDVAATAKLNADYYQIDDSWQSGKIVDLWHHNRHVEPDFWNISERLFGGSFAPLRDTAKKAGVKLGLWLAPSMNVENEDYIVLVNMIERMYREYGIDLFKIDGVLNRTKLAEENLERLLKTALERCDGAIYYNLDTTNGQRPGYFMFLNYGNIFLENRYVCHMWGLGYHPVKTLRSLWQLSRYICPQYLQIEVPNPADINEEFYATRPNPADYPVEYWAAVSLFANPLLWFSPSLCSDDIAKRISNVMAIHKNIWKDIHDSRIYPIGDEPCGRSFTGLQSCGEGGHGYILAFREAECHASEVQIQLADAVNSVPQLVYALGGAKCAAKGCNATLSLESPASFALWRY